MTEPAAEDSPDIPQPANTSLVEQSEEKWSGSGVWERGENGRWQVVENHIIPRRSLTSERGLVFDMGITPFLSCFETEISTASENSQIIQTEDSMVRITENLENLEAPELRASSQEPVAGPSGCSHQQHSRKRIKSIKTDSEEDADSDIEGSDKEEKQQTPVGKQKKRRKNRKKSKKKKQGKRPTQGQNAAGGDQEAAGGRRKSTRGTYERSAESSPGRDSPSPTALATICLVWERMKAEEEEEARTKRAPNFRQFPSTVRNVPEHGETAVRSRVHNHAETSVRNVPDCVGTLVRNGPEHVEAPVSHVLVDHTVPPERSVPDMESLYDQDEENHGEAS